jgi:hypothetical protein
MFLYEHRFLLALVEIFVLLGFLLLYGIVGFMDYHDERMMECLKYDKDYDEKEDMCK